MNDETDDALIERLHKSTWRERLRFGRVVATGFVLALVYASTQLAADSERIVREGERSSTTITRITQEPREGKRVFVMLGGAERRLTDGDSLDHDPKVGETVRIAVEGEEVVAVDGRKSWQYSDLGKLAFLLFGVGLVWLVGHFYRGKGLEAARALEKDAEVVPVQIVEGRAKSVTVLARGEQLVWHGDVTGRVPNAGGEMRLAGHVREGGYAWLVLDDGAGAIPTKALTNG